MPEHPGSLFAPGMAMAVVMMSVRGVLRVTAARLEAAHDHGLVGALLVVRLGLVANHHGTAAEVRGAQRPYRRLAAGRTGRRAVCRGH